MKRANPEDGDNDEKDTEKYACPVPSCAYTCGTLADFTTHIVEHSIATEDHALRLSSQLNVIGDILTRLEAFAETTEPVTRHALIPSVTSDGVALITVKASTPTEFLRNAKTSHWFTCKRPNFAATEINSWDLKVYSFESASRVYYILRDAYDEARCKLTASAFVEFCIAIKPDCDNVQVVLGDFEAAVLDAYPAVSATERYSAVLALKAEYEGKLAALRAELTQEAALAPADLTWVAQLASKRLETVEFNRNKVWLGQSLTKELVYLKGSMPLNTVVFRVRGYKGGFLELGVFNRTTASNNEHGTKNVGAVFRMDQCKITWLSGRRSGKVKKNIALDEEEFCIKIARVAHTETRDALAFSIKTLDDDYDADFRHLRTLPIWYTTQSLPLYPFLHVDLGDLTSPVHIKLVTELCKCGPMRPAS